MINLDHAAPAPNWLKNQTPPTCLLCSRPTEISGVWLISARRAIVYGLCNSHAEGADLHTYDIESAVQRLTRGGQL